MILVLRFNLEKLEKLSFHKIIPEFFDVPLLNIFPGKFRKSIIGIGLMSFKLTNSVESWE